SFPDVAPTAGDNAYGNFEMTAGTWSYTLDDTNPAVQALGAGESLTDTFTFTASDGNSQVVTITINGADDASVISGTIAGAVTEDAGVPATGTLTITDTDTSDTPSFPDVAPTAGDNAYGNFEMTSGTWTYTLDDTNPAVQALGAGESLTDTFTFTASDGNSQVVTITINGADDASVISGTTAGAVTEDAGVPATGTLTITDTDTSDTPSFPDVAPTAGDNAYGNFEMTSGAWTYTLDNANAAVQGLDVGESISDTFTFVATDGNTQVVTITVSGSEDSPSVDNPLADQSATEDVAFGYTFPANTFGDVDTSDTLTYTATLADNSPLPAWLNFDAVTRTFSGTPANADVGAIDVKVTADDGSSTVSDLFTLTVLNTNDPPVIGGTGVGSVSQNINVSGGNIATSGSLTISDPDVGESSFVTATVNGLYGDLVIDSSGNWRYSADNGIAEIQALVGGQTLVDTLTVTTADGSSFDVVITIVGTDEVASSTGSGGVGTSAYVPPDDVVPTVQPPEIPVLAVVGGFETSLAEDIESAPQDREIEPEAGLSGLEQSGTAAQPVEDVQYASLDDGDRNPIEDKPAAQKEVRDQPIDIEKLGLQVSDDEAVNQRFEQALLKHLDSMNFGIDGEDGYRSADDIKVQVLMGTTATLTAGIVSWVLRGGSLLASLMSTVPLLNRFDPLPILKNREEREDVEPDDDTEITGPVGEQHRRVDKMFSSNEDG
ncbi:MAG TPA: VCBS domain-containing protein, partial [Gammaproteobacteria bacterium]|nr:VCBS domain-containing protein [Gammaproteobacteria bacterium]